MSDTSATSVTELTPAEQLAVHGGDGPTITIEISQWVKNFIDSVSHWFD